MSSTVHRLLVMWAPPRSLSTAFVRVMAARGDFSILHEPLCDLVACGHFMHRQAGDAPRRLDTAPALFEHIERLRRDNGPVFIKDTCEYDYCDILDGSDYLRDATHIFMLREPASVINSHYNINPEMRCEDVGYEHLARVYDLVRLQARAKPLFIDAERLVADPADTVARFCEHVGLTHLPESLQWENGHLDIWKRTKHWHQDVANSNCIVPIGRQYAARVDNHKLLRGFYQANRPFYDYLCQQARSMLT